MKMPIWILRTLIKISCLYFLVLWRLRHGVWILARFTLNTKLMRLTFCPEKKKWYQYLMKQSVLVALHWKTEGLETNVRMSMFNH